MADRRVKIRFHAALKKRVGDPAWPDGRIPVEWLLHGAPQRFDPASGKVVDADVPGLAHLSFGEGGTAYLTDPNADPSDADPDVYFAEVPEQTDAFVHLRLWRVRRSQLPSLHDLSDGSTNPIGLASTQGIAEASDLVLFRQSCVVGWLVNRAGPSQGNVLRYLEERTAVSMRLPVLHREDALDLVRGDLVTAVDVEVASGHFEALANVTSEIGNAAQSVNTPGLRTIRVTFGAVREERARFWQWWRPRARRIVALGSEQVRRMEVTQTRSDDFAAQTIDLLSQAIGLETPVRLQAGRTVEAADARGAIVDAFNSFNDLIARAADRLDAVAENQRVERRSRRSRSSQWDG